MRIVFACALLVLAAGSPGADGQETTVPPSSTMTYDEFARLDQAKRHELWRILAPEAKSALMRAHTERWLDRNRQRLSPGQVALVQEGIAFVTPELYANPNDPELLKREAAFRAKLHCSLRQSDAINAFQVLSPDEAPSSWRSDLWAWLEHCVIG